MDYKMLKKKVKRKKNMLLDSFIFVGTNSVDCRNFPFLCICNFKVLSKSAYVIENLYCFEH